MFLGLCVAGSGYAKPLRADGSTFTLDAHSTGRCRWFYGSPHPLAALLEPGYFDSIRDHRPSRGDQITVVYCAPDEPLERAELIVITGVDQLGPRGERPAIAVEPSGPAYLEKLATKRQAAA